MISSSTCGMRQCAGWLSSCVQSTLAVAIYGGRSLAEYLPMSGDPQSDTFMFDGCCSVATTAASVLPVHNRKCAVLKRTTQVEHSGLYRYSQEFLNAENQASTQQAHISQRKALCYKHGLEGSTSSLWSSGACCWCMQATLD